MELNSAEEQVSEICILYKRLMQTDCKIELPPINVSLNNAEENKLLGLSIPSDPKFVMSAFEKMQTTLCELETKMTRFQSRSREVDPVTGNPRYGPSTLKRVLAFLGRYQEVNTCVLAVFGDSKDAEERTSSSTSVIDFVRQQVREQEEIERQMKQAELEQFEREAAAKKADEERATEERRRRECEIEQQAERKRQELAREYEQVRLNQQIAREAAEQRDKEWLAGIKHGAEGVREQLDILIECTAADPVAQVVSIDALHTLFSQILARPEEVKFRRIRRNHEKFQQDIGRHKGGREILIASGFELGAIDDVPCFISKEPDLERDMDSWSAWFDLLKSTLDLLKERLDTCKNSMLS